MSLEWTPALAVGNAEIDEQHQELFRRAARLVNALRAGDRGEVEPVSRYLLDYVASHFALEERWMRDAGYPGLAAHRAVHEAFREKLVRVVEDLRRKGPTVLVALELHNFVAGWLVEHVSGADVELARWLAAR